MATAAAARHWIAAAVDGSIRADAESSGRNG
jgi:hypothetical protein